MHHLEIVSGVCHLGCVCCQFCKCNCKLDLLVGSGYYYLILMANVLWYIRLRFCVDSFCLFVLLVFFLGRVV